MRTDFPALIDEWASRFFEELDYIKEGNNGIRFFGVHGQGAPPGAQAIVSMRFPRACAGLKAMYFQHGPMLALKVCILCELLLQHLKDPCASP